MELVIDGRAVELTKTQYNLVVYLSYRQGEWISKEELLTMVMDKPVPFTDQLDSHLTSLRKRLGETAKCPRHLWSDGQSVRWKA